MPLRSFAPLFVLLSSVAPARAITLRISAQALERTLQKQLFTAPDGRYFIRGHAGSGCYITAENPKVSFRGDRVVVHVTTHAKLGTSVRGDCLGVGLGLEADVTLLPEAQGETIGFRDARIENLNEATEFRELNFFLEPFLNRKLPQELKVSAADQLRQLLSTSLQTTGYDLKLDTLTIHSMQVSGNALVVDLDGDLDVH